MSENSGKTIKPTPLIERHLLSAKAADVLREKIIEGEFPQGYKLIEEDLSKLLGVSRACIREAVMQLENEGLVVRTQGRSREVATFRKADFTEIYMLRLYIEKLAVATCLENGAFPVAALRKKAEEIDRLVLKKPINCIKLTEEDLGFHEAIIAAAGSKRALQVWQGLKSQIRTLMYLYFTTTPKAPQPNDYANHGRLIEAFQNGDQALIDDLLETHILSGLKTISEM
jgi:DNA-binding GntR family transcriptional regulator